MFIPKVARPPEKAVKGSAGGLARIARPSARPAVETMHARADLSRIPVFAAGRGPGRAEDRLGGGGGTQASLASTPVPASPAAAAAPALPVTFGKVDSPTTPLGMPARIPPRIGQDVAVTFAGPDSVDLSLAGAPANGMATLDGAETVSLASSGTIALRGTAQTPPGSGALQLSAKSGETLVGLGNPFTIAAIPMTVSIADGKPMPGPDRGLIVTTYNDSDSEVLEDLDQVKMEERVEWLNGQGCFEGVTTGKTSGPYPANVSPHGPDAHGYPAYLIDRPGSIDTHQHFVFADLRSGVGNALVRNSGFKIRREVTEVEADGETSLWITTSKEGMAVAQAGPGLGRGTSGPQKV